MGGRNFSPTHHVSVVALISTLFCLIDAKTMRSGERVREKKKSAPDMKTYLVVHETVERCCSLAYVAARRSTARLLEDIGEDR